MTEINTAIWFKGGKVKGLVFLQGEQSFACATDKGDLYIIK